MNEEVLALVRYELRQKPWRVTEIYKKAVQIDGRLAKKGVDRFRRQYIIPLLNGEKEDNGEIPGIDVPHREFRSRLKQRMKSMEKEEKNHRHECPKETCIGGSKNRAGLARHIDTQHPDEADVLREQAGFDPQGGPKSEPTREPLLLSPEKQEKVLEILKRGVETPEYSLPEREEVRSAFLSFAREVRDTSDALEVAASLDTFVDLMYELFTQEDDNGSGD